jgi:hypothetical protein
MIRRHDCSYKNMQVSPKDLDSLAAVLPRFTANAPTRSTSRVFEYDYCCAIPKGDRCLAWFHAGRTGPVCHIFDGPSHRGKYKLCRRWVCSFDDVVAGGTVVEGVRLDVKGRTFFCIVDVHYYAGRDVSQLRPAVRDSCMSTLLGRMNPANYSDTCVTFAAPVRARTYKELSSSTATLPYVVSDVMYVAKGWNTRKVHARMATSAPSRPRPTCVFRITAHPEHDLYTLSAAGHPSGHPRWAAIQTLQESQDMNRLFRKIRENDDLDYTEMSGDEESFEDVSESKYLQRATLHMECGYVRHLRKWRPIRVSHANMSTVAEVLRVERPT